MPCRQICSRHVLELEQVDGSAARALCEGRFLDRGFACNPSGGEGYRAAPFLLCREGRRAPAKWKGSWDIRGARFGTSCIVSHILDPSGGERYRAAPFLLCREGRRALEIITRRSRESLHPLPRDLTTPIWLPPSGKGSGDVRGARFETPCIVSHFLDPSVGEGFRAAPFLLCREGRRALEIDAERLRAPPQPLRPLHLSAGGRSAPLVLSIIRRGALLATVSSEPSAGPAAPKGTPAGRVVSPSSVSRASPDRIARFFPSSITASGRATCRRSPCRVGSWDTCGVGFEASTVVTSILAAKSWPGRATPERCRIGLFSQICCPPLRAAVTNLAVRCGIPVVVAPGWE